MGNSSTGSEIVAGMAGSRPWWKLRACDIQPWIEMLPPAATQDMSAGIHYIGDAWDGASDIRIGREVLSKKDAAKLLRDLRLGIGALQDPSIALPDAMGFRTCSLRSSDHPTLIIDSDLGDFILPVYIEEWHLPSRKRWTVPEIARTMVELMRQVALLRVRIVKREQGLRRAFEETAARIGDGVGALWLRMQPLQVIEDAKLALSQPYAWCMVTLNETLEWSPVGSDKAYTMKDVRNDHRYYARGQRRRAEILAKLLATGSVGSVTEVALALIEEQKLEPSEVFREAIELRRNDRRAGVEFVRKGASETLYYRDGVLEAAIMFEGGHYFSGTLTLWGDFPEAIAMAAKGRKLASIVDHPAFRTTEIVIKKTELRQQAFDLYHDIRTIPVEAVNFGRVAGSEAGLDGKVRALAA